MKPSLPDERPRVDRDAYRDLRAAASPGEVDDIIKAYAAAGEALEVDDVARAVELLTWAKSAAARSASVREALGIALYRAGSFATAHSELQAYRRLSGRQDQNHLLADCARALGRQEKVAEYIDAMRGPDVPKDRFAEGLIVLAADRADRDDVRGAMAALAEADLAPENVEDYHPRVWYLAAELSERIGEAEHARQYLEAIASVDPDFLDVAERLEGFNS